ncbi:MAG: enoyl-CoA hydratase-related protein [Asticcacaulis sp.]|uniref:enoyl-CoA hydratase-related protein n=1 Tax=Asticcacaulis sp. TaxID=1872648 RepID=UPI003F7C1F9D
MIVTTEADGVVTLRMDRPAKKNALTKTMYAELTDALIKAQANDATRAVIIAASGDDFCAGNDIMDFAQGLPELRAAADLEDLPVFRFLKALTFFDKPLIAAVQGQAVGVGVTLLLHCDLVAASEDARLSLPFLKLGLVPEAGSTLLLPQRIGHQRAFAWMALGEVIGAAEARELGLINRVVARDALDAAAAEMARRVAALPPNAVRQTKGFLRDREALWQVVRAEGEVFRELLFSPEAQAAFMAFMSK